MSSAPASPRPGRPRFAEPRVNVEHLADGGMILRSPLAPKPEARCLGEWLQRWAATAPRRVFLAQRDTAGGWRRVAYAEAWSAAQAIGQALLDRALGPERPLMILSDNGIEHALLALGAMHVGVPVAPVSTAYSLRSQDFAALRSVGDQLRPGLVFAERGNVYAKALRALGLGETGLVVCADPPEGSFATEFAALSGTRPGAAAADAHAATGPDTVAKILFTSGSTGNPKGVITTQRMLCSNQEVGAQCWPFLEDRPPVLVDWLPWNHTFGGSFNFNLVLRNGGTLYIDEGKPAPGLIERTVANLREISPTLYFNVPAGYAMLLPHFERDRALAANFFRDLDILHYAGSALPQSLWDRLEAVAERTLGRQVAMTSGWGTTETAPGATAVHYPMDRPGNIGLPAPGIEIKLVPNAGKTEIRVRGPNVTPGYWRRPDLTEAAFDTDGFYRPGDAVRLADPDDPAKGIVFDGRIAENFKLTTGTWVSAGALRVAAISACAPVIEDAVVTGHDRDEAGLLVFPSLAGCRALCPHLPADAPLATLIGQPAVRRALAAGLARHNANAGGSSQRIGRALMLTEPPSIDRGEITDKGYINQRAVLAARAAEVGALYGAVDDAGVVLPDAAAPG